MPRMGRVVLPGFPHHIVQRGHNRDVVFAQAEDYEYYLNTLMMYHAAFDVKVLAYCLMTNHVHLLLEPDNVVGLGALMKRLAGRQTRFNNQQEGRRGTLWESRYKSSPVDSDEYLLACVRYIEMNPVNARMVSSPEQYPWSSCRAHLGIDENSWLERDWFATQFSTSDDRATKYKDYLLSAVPEQERELIKTAVSRCQLTGSLRFIEKIEAVIGRRVEYRGQGRPMVREYEGVYDVDWACGCN